MKNTLDSFWIFEKKKIVVFRECKNRYIFSYLKSLIDCGVFKEIFVNFLPVGHTHCDIDQMFSRFSVHLKGECTLSNFKVSFKFAQDLVLFQTKLLCWTANSAYDFEELAINLKRAFSDCKIVEALEKFTNFSATIDPFLNVASKTPGYW